jgi:hypothetical protein
MKYYKPTKEDLVLGMDLEFYHEAEDTWTKFRYDPKVHTMPLEDLRIKYLDSLDFNNLGYNIKQIFIKKQEQIKEILICGTEITEEIDIFDEEVLIVLKNNIPVGQFYPYAPNEHIYYNVEYKGKKQVVKNLHELRKILK